MLTNQILEPITTLPVGTVKATDTYIATDTTDTTDAITGTTKKYTIQQLATYLNASQGNWVNVTTATQQIVIDTSYVANYVGGQVVFTLPVTSPFGAFIQIQGLSSSGWKIQQNFGQNIQIGAQSTTAGLL